MILLVVDLIYNLIIDRWKMIPLQFLNKEEGVDINTNGEDNIAIGYDYTFKDLICDGNSKVENY